MAALIPSASATGSGTMTLAGPSTNSNQTVTIPDATGTMMVSGNMPAFAVYCSSGQSITGGSFTKVQWNTKVFDTASAFDNATNYRFTPQVAGYYQINALVGSQSVNTENIVSIYKNGSELNRGFDQKSANTDSNVSSVVYLNGSTDYVEIYVYFGSTGTVQATYARTYFNGCLMRAA